MRIALPSNPEAWVVCDPSRITVKDAETLTGSLAAAITEWNLDEPVSEGSVGNLPFADARYIMDGMDLKPPQDILNEVTLALTNDNADSEYPVPREYSLYRYRKEMGITWSELMSTPLGIVTQDMQFISIENQIKNNHAS